VASDTLIGHQHGSVSLNQSIDHSLTESTTNPVQQDLSGRQTQAPPAEADGEPSYPTTVLVPKKSGNQKLRKQPPLQCRVRDGKNVSWVSSSELNAATC
jgi:hypothetical protein